MNPLFRFIAGARAVLLCLLLASTPVLAAPVITYFHNDIAGTPVAATDASGNIVWRENYRPYGDRLNNQPASSNNKLWFTGKPFDPTTGLSYMGARYYDPALGRFVGMDPKGFDLSSLHGFNQYAYANNNPYRFVDPDGHSPIDIAFLVYDLGKLATAMYSGVGVWAAVADVTQSAVGVVSPIPGTGQALRVARAAERGVDAGKAAEGVALSNGVANNAGTRGYRYMAESEIQAIKGTGKLRGGNPGETFFTKDVYKSADMARQRLSLPSQPTHRVEFEIKNNPTLQREGAKVKPDFGQPGKGSEFMTSDPIKADLINIQPLRR